MTAATERRDWERFVWPVLVGIGLLALWQLCVIWSKTRVFPSPFEVEKGIIELARGKLLWKDILDSLRRVAVGYGAAVITGVPIGLLLGWFPAANQVVNPTLQLLRPISPIAWIPVAIVFFGIGDAPAIFLIFLASFFPIVVACVDGVATVPAVYRQVGRNFGMSPARLLRRVIFPAALPQILTGLRISLGIAWLVVVAAEMIAVDSGLGFLVIDSRNAGKRYDLVVAAMLMIGVIGLILDLVFRRIARNRALRWGFRDGA